MTTLHRGSSGVLIRSRASSGAARGQVMAEVQSVLGRRSEMKHPPVTLAVSDSVALGIAQIFASASQTGQVLERFVRTGAANSNELIAAAEFEQGYASPEGYAALYCLVGWAKAQVHRRSVVA